MTTRFGAGWHYINMADKNINMKKTELRRLIKRVLKEQLNSQRPPMPSRNKNINNLRNRPKPQMGQHPNAAAMKAKGFSNEDYARIVANSPDLQRQGCPATVDGRALNEIVWGALVFFCNWISRRRV